MDEKENDNAPKLFVLSRTKAAGSVLARANAADKQVYVLPVVCDACVENTLKQTFLWMTSGFFTLSLKQEGLKKKQLRQICLLLADVDLCRDIIVIP